MSSSIHLNISHYDNAPKWIRIISTNYSTKGVDNMSLAPEVKRLYKLIKKKGNLEEALQEMKFSRHKTKYLHKGVILRHLFETIQCGELKELKELKDVEEVMMQINRWTILELRDIDYQERTEEDY